MTFSFDDCEIYDRILCDMFRKHGMRATFFLISNSLGRKVDFHRYGLDTVVERVSADEINKTYVGMEVATHTASHRCPIGELDEAVAKSAEYLSTLCGYEVLGMAYPGGEYTQQHIAELKKLGIKYARTTECTYDFNVPTEWLAWNPTCKYDDKYIWKLAEQFINYQGKEPKVFHIYGHSYEMTRKDERCSFDEFERLLCYLSNRKDIIYATNIEVMEALSCME